MAELCLALLPPADRERWTGMEPELAAAEVRELARVLG